MSLSSYAGEPLPPGAVDASAERDQRARSRGADRGNPESCSIGCRRGRDALRWCLPDTVGKLSLVRFEKVPAKAQDLDQLIRWQVRKAAPFKIEDAQVVLGSRHRAARRRP